MNAELTKKFLLKVQKFSTGLPQLLKLFTLNTKETKINRHYRLQFVTTLRRNGYFLCYFV